MTPAQHGRYWRDWGKVRKVLIEMGGYSAKDADAERKEIHKEALSFAKSSKNLNNKDLDKIFDAFGKYLVLLNGPQSGPTVDPACKRLIWAIERLALDAPYLEKIALDQFKRPDWRNLDEERLSNFRKTCTARFYSLKRKEAGK